MRIVGMLQGSLFEQFGGESLAFAHALQLDRHRVDVALHRIESSLHAGRQRRGDAAPFDAPEEEAQQRTDNRDGDQRSTDGIGNLHGTARHDIANGDRGHLLPLLHANPIAVHTDAHIRIAVFTRKNDGTGRRRWGGNRRHLSRLGGLLRVARRLACAARSILHGALCVFDRLAHLFLIGAAGVALRACGLRHACTPELIGRRRRTSVPAPGVLVAVISPRCAVMV
jgi:hypothetical protein